MSGPQGGPQQFRQQQAQYRIVTILARVVSSMRVTIAGAGLFVVILFDIPWFNDYFVKLNPNNPDAVILTLVTVVIVSMFFEVRALANRLDDTSVGHHFADPMAVYPVLLERIRLIDRTDEKVLDVLGMTLYTAWPSIQFWLGRSDLAGWTIRLAAVAHEDHRLSPQVPAFWFRDARNNLDAAVSFGKSTSATQRQITIQTFGYDFAPALHGYRLGNGDLFYSIVLWQPDGNLGYEGFSYEFVPHEDHSPSAMAIRSVFESWFQRATQTAWSGTVSTTTTP